MAEADPIVGQTIGGFVAERLLGEGGFARVYLARRTSDGRTAALKILAGRSTSPDSEQARRFEREAKLVAMLQAPGTIRLLGYGREGEHFYIAFEHVDGEALDDVIARGPLTPHHVELIFRTLLQSLGEAHRLGVLHRDLKPANIMLDRVGQAKLLDFGVAHVQADVLQLTAELTRTGTILGTVQYMAPENLREQELTPASDLYSLGLVVYEMLTGQPAVAPGTAFEMARQHLDGNLKLPVGPWPATLREAVNACLRRKPETRPQTAEQVLELLTSAARPVAPVAPPRQAAPRGRFAPLALGAVLILAAATFFLTRSSAPPPAGPLITTNTRALLQTPPTEPARSTSPAPSGPCAPRAKTATGWSTVKTLEGLDRRDWYVYVPTSYVPGKRHPAVVVFHDLRRPSKEFAAEAGLAELADARGWVLIVHSDPVIMPWFEPDTEWLSRSVSGTAERVCLDDERVFALGHGAGGRAVERLACVMPLRGIATKAFRSLEAEPLCEPYVPTPYLQLTPLEDGFEPVEGGVGCGARARRALQEKETLWRERNRCTGDEVEYATYEDGTCVTWSCAEPLIACRIAGGRLWKGMSDPAREITNPGCSRASNFPSTEVIATFFEAQMAEPTAAGEDAGAPERENR